ncbi:MAG: hypothetical protein CMG74_11370 [Candidatus Marinimicrobia bacterium]|nr:hypothetical protein [Candidatus Neomarinimicrobiota bacterium]
MFAQSGEEDFLDLNYSSEIYNRGSSSSAFLEIGVGARATALGNAYTAVSDDPTTMFWNPAGLSWVDGLQISFNHADWLASTDFENVSLAVPIKVNHTLGIYFTYLNYVQDQKVRTITQPEGTGEYYAASDFSLGTTYSGKLGKRFSFGFTWKYIRQEIWHEIADGYALDVGIHYKTKYDGLVLGSSISNFGSEMRLNGRDLTRAYDADQLNYSNDKLNVLLKTESFPLPLIIRSGLSYSKVFSSKSSILLLMDLLHPTNDSESINLGFECTILDIIALRTGYHSLFNTETVAGATFGIGIKSSKNIFLPFDLDYSYSDWGILQMVHRFSIGFSL